MWRQKIKCHRGRRLTNEQVAIAAVLAQAISNYSEDSFCAGWYSGIEHELWERIVPRRPDHYERAVEKLYSVARGKRSDWGKPSAEFLAGLKTLAKGFQVWIYYKKGETAIHLQDWLPIHEAWRSSRIKERPGLEEVWSRIHEPFAFLKADKRVRIPPMPKLS
jgi:hypothetical protein